MTLPEPEPEPAGLPNPIDVLVFAPIGLAAAIHERLRTEQQRVEQRVQLYRLVGRLTVQHGQTQLRRRIDRAVDDRRGPG
jgi:hypothetical protein